MPNSHNQDHVHEAEHVQHHQVRPKRRIVTHRHGGNYTNPLIWLIAIICTIMAIAVIILGISVFVGYIVIHPRFPTISIPYAHLDLLRNDYAGLLQTQLTIVVMAQNGNAKAHATFSDMVFKLSYQGQDIAILVAHDPFDVPKNNSKFLTYVVQSRSIPLNPDQMEEVGESWNRNMIGFDLKGNGRTRWRVGAFGSMKFSCHLECHLKFHPLNGSYIPSRCTSQSK